VQHFLRIKAGPRFRCSSGKSAIAATPTTGSRSGLAADALRDRARCCALHWSRSANVKRGSARARRHFIDCCAAGRRHSRAILAPSPCRMANETDGFCEKWRRKEGRGRVAIPKEIISKGNKHVSKSNKADAGPGRGALTSSAPGRAGTPVWF